MGIFSRFKKGGSKKQNDKGMSEDVQAKGTKKKKSKGLAGLFMRKKSSEGIIDMMQLDDAVASMALSNLQDLVESNEDSAVRELDEGYTAVALTEEILQELGVDTESADFGSFANAIKYENISTILLGEDLEQGVIVIIPDRDTLDILDEYMFLEDVVYSWVVIPYDVDDDSSVILLENGATLGDLNVIADDDLELTVQNGQVSVVGEESDGVSDYDDYDDVGEYDDMDDDYDDFGMADDMDDFGEDTFGGLLDADDGVIDEEIDAFDDIDQEQELYDQLDDDSGSFDSLLDDSDGASGFDDFDEVDGFDDVPETDFEPIESSPTFDEVEDDDVYGLDDFDLEDDEEDVGFDLDDDIELEDDDIYDVYDEGSSLQTEDVGRDVLLKVIDREFHNDELGVSIKGDAYNHQFGDIGVIMFGEEPSDDSELAHTVAEMRRDANTQLINLHQKHQQRLRSQFDIGLSKTHDKLVAMLDYKDPDTTFGERYKEIVDERDYNDERSDELVAQHRRTLDEKYEAEREDFGNRAKREAVARYDDDHKERHEEKKQELGQDVATEIKLAYDESVGKLYEDRRYVAKRIFDKMTTELLLELQEMHEEQIEEENSLYELFQETHEQYIRNNYTDEIMRAKALDEELRQYREADKVRSEYEQMLESRRRELLDVNETAERELQKAKQEYSQEIKETIESYESELTKKDDELKNLRGEMNSLHDKITLIKSETAEEFEQRLKINDDTIESQRKQIEYEQSRADKQSRSTGIMLAGMVITGIAIGAIIGFILGAKNEPVQQAPGVETPTISLIHQLEDESSLQYVLDTTFNELFADKL